MYIYIYLSSIKATFGYPKPGFHTTFELRRPKSVVLLQSIMATLFSDLAVKKQRCSIHFTSKFLVCEFEALIIICQLMSSVTLLAVLGRPL